MLKAQATLKVQAMRKAPSRLRPVLYLLTAALLIQGRTTFAQEQAAAEKPMSSFDPSLLAGFSATPAVTPGQAIAPPGWARGISAERVAGIRLIAEALSWQAVPYRLGGESREGVDCSGFVRTVLSLTLPSGGPFPRTSEGFAQLGAKQTLIEPGDILVFSEAGKVFHVGIALSENSFIHAASDGPRTGVIISSLHESYWAQRLSGIRRIDY